MKILANSADPGLTAPDKEQSDLGLLFFAKAGCPSPSS